mmetsp:Transcript_17654/g.44074  ORF Transcript_17654/g.44074 Transcript_17654/m.44074 type:complete len:200 (+) Transcript_17654:1399-1998(+)
MRPVFFPGGKGGNPCRISYEPSLSDTIFAFALLTRWPFSTSTGSIASKTIGVLSLLTFRLSDEFVVNIDDLLLDEFTFIDISREVTQLRACSIFRFFSPCIASKHRSIVSPSFNRSSQGCSSTPICRGGRTIERLSGLYKDGSEGNAMVEKSIIPGSPERLDAARKFSDELPRRITESPPLRPPVSNFPKPKLPLSNGA